MEFNGHKLRHELKYLINYRDYHVLRERLAIAAKRDVFSSPDYFIRSLYFDDFNDSAYHDKIAGILNRKKYRIRTYDLNKNIIKLEQKQKFGDYISKNSVNIDIGDYYKILSGDVNFAIEHGDSLLRRFYIEYRSFLLRPVVIVDYRREAFVCNEGNVRVTFDSELHCAIGSFDIFSHDIITIPAVSSDKLVMEIKYDDYIPLGIKKLLTPHASINTAFSKYVVCRNCAKQYSGGSI